MSIPYAEAALQRCSHEKTLRKIRSKSTEEHPRRSVTSTKRPCSFIEVTLQRGRPHQTHRTNPQNTFPQEHPQRTASAYTQKSKLI